MNEERQGQVGGRCVGEGGGGKIVFNGRAIRKIWYKEEWYFSVVDIVDILTESRDVKQYINKMRQRDESLKEGWVQIVHPLSLKTVGGKQLVNCANKQGIFRIIQYIFSKKAEPFKLWLAKVGSERIDEIREVII
jgi:DNA-damage-inducible protein D